ncbi:head-tail adaptor protein [Sphingobacterium griseoflavum]|uniref:Head-tail adaptor protein n=1 Tax=Sphingobacterium griseoflavum TaxID=1474952 RepID=A0ABQ3HU34_9SPHI|nr:hypothetical protein [Sphingobacterium griseoflavum]GHE34881.1 hypothetical protein GCM10017764_17590 [Sphingobacterium griseoflavum]
MLRAGKYDQKIVFLTFGSISNGAGGYIPDTEGAEVLSTFARVMQIRQSWNIEQVQKGLPTTYRVGVQIRSGFEPAVNMVVRWKGQDYQMITSPTVEDVRMGQEWVFDITKNG